MYMASLNGSFVAYFIHYKYDYGATNQLEQTSTSYDIKKVPTVLYYT